MKDDVFKFALDRLQTELNKANPARVAQQESNREVALALTKASILEEPSHRALLDKEFDNWIETGKWNYLEPIHALLVWERLYFGFLFGVSLYQEAGLRAERKTEPEILRFLLIKSWESIGVVRYRSKLGDTLLP